VTLAATISASLSPAGGLRDVAVPAVTMQPTQLRAGAPRLRALLAAPVERSGISHTCWSILQGGAAAGYSPTLHAAFLRLGQRSAFPVRTALPRPLTLLPFDLLKPLAQSVLQTRFLSALGADDIAYLWPGVPLRTFEAVARRGIPIVTEAVNTRMAAAREVLDAAYAALGVAPEHGITDARIAMQEARNALCAAIFAPSPGVEASYRATAHADRIVPASFGVWVPGDLPERPHPSDRPVRFLFVGRDDVRKGLHHLLQAWRRPPEGAELRIVGEISPLLRRLFADVLNLPSVSAAGFSSEMAAEYRAADVAVLPSLEEGDPIATYEAAAHGLPVIASLAGAGRIGAETGVVEIIAPEDTEALRASLALHAADAELRRYRGATCRAAALAYDWSRVAPDRLDRLFAFLAR
jgi:glycosyltransferase involved in cell wall biosynthesis